MHRWQGRNRRYECTQLTTRKRSNASQPRRKNAQTITRTKAFIGRQEYRMKCLYACTFVTPYKLQSDDAKNEIKVECDIFYHREGRLSTHMLSRKKQIKCGVNVDSMSYATYWNPRAGSRRSTGASFRKLNHMQKFSLYSLAIIIVLARLPHKAPRTSALRSSASLREPRFSSQQALSHFRTLCDCRGWRHWITTDGRALTTCTQYLQDNGHSPVVWPFSI
jgi:hypothetical protein